MKNDDATPGAGKSAGIGRQQVFFALLSGILLFLSFPKYGLGFIAWIAFVPLFIALRNVTSLRSAFFLGWLAGLCAYSGIVYWIVFVVVHYGSLPLTLGIPIMLLLASYLGFYFAVFSTGLVYFRSKIPLILAAPGIWVCLEYIKSHLFTGFPWENLGYSQFRNLFLLQFADIAGVYGLSFLILLLNVAFFAILTQKNKKSFVLAGMVFLVWSGVYAYGIQRISQVTQAYQNGQSMNVSLIQGNIDQSVKWNQQYQNQILNTYEELTLHHSIQPKGLIVWPETAVPFYLQEQGDFQRKVIALPVRTESWLLVGSVSYTGKGTHTDYFNSAFLLSPSGDIAGKYDKVHLVPYGEYVPLKTVFPFISRLAQGIGDFAQGMGFKPLDMGGRKIGILICYEGILPEAGRKYKNASADLLVNITNDAWFGATSAPYQHLSMSIFRAVETRLFLVRAANTGISAIVDPTGQIIAKTSIFQKDQLSGTVKFATVPTIYAQYGDILVWTCFICLAVVVFISIQGRKKCQQKTFKK
ncbi:MAG: apolipoprotein N-acyltransferase [Syntrophaceae bacterium]|nr:apolipoprotein N-acyltransferase [Syntrophaceae bacterium]